MHCMFISCKDFDTLPTLEESLGSISEPKRSSAWVYCPDEDDTTTSLYPMGIELPNDYPDGVRKLPVRHASFAMPRYAKVHQRPQRSHSFAQQRDLNIERILKGSLRGPLPVGLPKLPRPKLIITSRGHYAKPNRPVMRSNSMQVTKSEKAENSEPTLSNKFHACSLDELDSSSVLEVGSLASGKSSEHSLVDALTDIPSRSINSMQSAGFAAYNKYNQTNEAIARANRYSAHSFSSPTLHSMETLEKSSDSSSPLPLRYTIPEPDYARPSSLRLNNNYLGKINQDYHFKTSSQSQNTNYEHDEQRSSAADAKPYENGELSSFHPAVRSLDRSGKPKAPAPISPYTFIPRVSPIKSTHQNPQHNTTTEFRSNTTQTNSTVSNDFNRNNYHNPIYNNIESAKPVSTLERPSSVGKFSAGRHLETRITHFESNPLPVIEEVDRLSSEDYAPVHKPTEESYLQRDDAVRPAALQKPAVPTTPKPKIINVTKNGIVKPPRNSVLQKKMLNNQGSNETMIGDGRKNAGDIKRLENVLTAILDGDADTTREYYPQEVLHETELSNNTNKEVTRFPSQYEVAHREALDDTDQLLGRIPSGEIKRNKIVLRVPSFRTAGCQTESYKPVRRRASCAQTNLSVAPRNKEASVGSYRTIATGPSRWINPGNHSSPAQPETSSSSSGYSSPEVSSKDPSPNHSGPPSPAAKTSSPNERPRRSKSNVTVIEINKSENTTLISTIEAPPPRPPKPVRFRHSAAADLEGGGLLLPIHRKPKLTSTYQDVFGFSTLTENIITLTEAVNPVMIHPSRSHQTKSITSNQTISFNRSNTISNTPRIVDMHPKRISDHDEPISRAEVFAEDGRTSVLPRLRGVVLGPSGDHSQSQLNITPSPKFERSDNVAQNRWTDDLDWAAGQRWREERERELASRWSSDTGGRATAAYLASLELLASHYRHQALVNAKQLQRQKEFLDQQKTQQQQNEVEDGESLNSYESEESQPQKRQQNEEFGKETGTEWRASMEQLRHQSADERGVWHT